jgi:CRISPR-associated exonuclease Cas4
MDPIQLSLINDFLYCPRRAGIKLIEGCRSENEHTVRGDLQHEHADLPGYETAKGAQLLRALPVFSKCLGLNGKCDIVEKHPDGSLYPIEYKKGPRRKWANDDAQLCAQALCLEEMTSRPVPAGAIFHAASKRRREVAFTPELRALTEDAIHKVRDILASAVVPPPAPSPRCEGCSLKPMCLPELAGDPAKVARHNAALYVPADGTC